VVQNVENGVVWGSYGHSRLLEIAPFDTARVPISHLAFHSNYVPILHRFSHITRHWSKIAYFNTPHLYLAPPWEFHIDLWRQNTRVPVLSQGVVCVILRLAVLVQYPRVTDGWTDTE